MSKWVASFADALRGHVPDVGITDAGLDARYGLIRRHASSSRAL